VGLIGKATLYRQLGESYAEAMRNLPQVHNEIDKLFRNEAHVRRPSIILISQSAL
jgi:hypothetical protein